MGKQILYHVNDEGEAYYEPEDIAWRGHYEGRCEADFCELVEEKIETEKGERNEKNRHSNKPGKNNKF